MKGIGPFASRSRTERSTGELHPGCVYFTLKVEDRVTQVLNDYLLRNFGMEI